MAARKKRFSPAVGIKTVYRTRSAPRRRSSRKNTGIDKIPAAAATAGLALANMDAVQTIANDLSLNGVKTAASNAIQPDQIKKDAVYAGVGLVAGCVIKRFAPMGIKKALGSVAKKMPKVF